MFELLSAFGVGIVAAVTAYTIIGIVTKRTQNIRPWVNDEAFSSTRVNVIAVVVMVSVFIWLKNLVPALLAGIIIVYLPYQLAYMRHRRIKTQVLEQLSVATNLFANTLLITKSIPRSIEAVSLRIPDPVGGFFQSAYSELTFGVPIEQVADQLAKRMGISYGYIFTRLLKSSANQGEMVAPLFRDLSNKITAAQEQQNFQMGELASVRIGNMILLILPIPLYIILSMKFKEMAMFAATPSGRMIFTLWLVSIVVWMFMDRMVIDS